MVRLIALYGYGTDIDRDALLETNLALFQTLPGLQVLKYGVNPSSTDGELYAVVFECEFSDWSALTLALGSDAGNQLRTNAKASVAPTIITYEVRT